MNEIKKHSFEAVSLLTAANGMLEVTIIPALNQPDWIVPSALVLDSLAYSEDNEHKKDDSAGVYSWQQHSVALFDLSAADQTADRVIILEGNSAEQRLALKTRGELRQIEVSISEVQDSDLPQAYRSSAEKHSHEVKSNEGGLSTEVITSYLYQAINIEDKLYIVPDLDKIAEHLYSIDSPQ